MCIKDIREDLTYANVAYFIPNNPQPVPQVDTQSEAKLQMGELFEYGSIPGNSLKALESLLTHVYLPLFQAGAVGKDTMPLSGRATPLARTQFVLIQISLLRTENQIHFS